MTIRGHGSAVAVVLSVLAVVVAGGGTAVAVSSAVNIADPSNPSRVARVDQNGRLAVGAPQGTINSAGYLYGFQANATNQVTSATNATLAISRVQLSNPASNTTAAEQQLSLNKYPVDGTGNCVTTTSPTLLARYDLASGHDVDDTFPAPLIVKPTGSTRYCLWISVNYLGGSSDTPNWYLSYGLTAYAAAGTYAGIGVATAATRQPNSGRIAD